MSVRRFVGANSRDVMRQVREVLGDDALIVANRRTEGGVEILAMADDAVDQFDPAPSPATQQEPAAPVFSLPQQPDPLEVMSERLLREMQEMRELLARRQPDPAPRADSASEHLQQVMLRVGFSHELRHFERIGRVIFIRNRHRHHFDFSKIIHQIGFIRTHRKHF